MEFSVEKDGFFGTLYIPEKDRCKGKALIVFGGSDGIFRMTRIGAEVFCRSGLCVLAIAYWNEEGLPKEIRELPAEAVEKAALKLREMGYEKIGVWGVSLGGELALLAGSLMSEMISCVVSINPLTAVTQGLSWKPRLHMLQTSAFSWRGNPLPYACPKEVRTGNMLKSFLRHREVYMRDLYEEGFAAGIPEEAEIAVERIGGPLLLLSAQQDSMCPSRWGCERVMARLKEKGFRFPHEHVNYEYASHLLLPFKAISSGMFAVERKFPEKCAASREAAFRKTLDFLEAW